MVIIRWGPLGWITPVYERDTHELLSPYESEARAEAEVRMELVERNANGKDEAKTDAEK
jgi:hypothetical protein